MFEKIEELIEAPEKRKKYLVFGIKTILSCILASFLYSKFIASYVLLDVLSATFWNELYTFLISGRILLVLLLFLVSRVVLFDVAAVLITSIMNLLIGLLKADKENLQHPGLVGILLTWTHAIKIDKQSNKIYRGKEFDDFYNVIKIYRKKTSKEEVEHFKTLLINQVMHLYYIFVAIYYLILDFPSNTFLNILIISAGIMLFWFYLIIHIITQMLDANENNLFILMRMLNADKITEEFLDRYTIPYNYQEQTSLSPYARFVSEGNKQIAIDYILSEKPFSVNYIHNLPMTIERKGWQHVILISTQKPSPAAARLLKENSEKITVIVYDSKKILHNKLYRFFKKGIKQGSLTIDTTEVQDDGPIIAPSLQS